MKYRIYIVSILLMSIAFDLFSQNDSTAQRIDEVVVTGLRTQTNRNNVPMTISVVRRLDIEESSESALLPVLSERVPGMFVSERGVTGFGVAAGGAGAITMRGVGGGPTRQLLVLIDGHPQFMGMMGHHLPDAYVASDVEKVEVIRGPASILYGTNAMGGVINIISRKQNKDGWSANGRIMGGSFYTQKYMANAGLKKNRFDAFVSVNHDQTKGHRKNSDFRITNGYTQMGYKLSEKLKLSANISLADYMAQNPGKTSMPMYNNVVDIVRGVASLSLDNKFEYSEGAFLFFSNFGEHKINDGYSSSVPAKDFHYRSVDYNYGAILYQIFKPFAGNTLTTGIDYKNYGGHAHNNYFNGQKVNLVDTGVYELAGYAIMQQKIFQKLTLNAGLRLEHNKVFGNEWVPQLGFAYRPVSQTVLKGSIAKGFRSPSIAEMYMWAPANAALMPERMWSYELSVGQLFFDARLSAELTGFKVVGSNLIKTEMIGGQARNMNTGSFNNAGLEFSVSWLALRNLRVQANYSYLHMETPILYSPIRQFNISGSYKLNKWMFSANIQSIYKLYTVVGVNQVNQSYGLLNAKVSHRPIKWMEIFTKGENLTGAKYETIYEYPMPGVTLFAGINIHLD